MADGKESSGPVGSVLLLNDHKGEADYHVHLYDGSWRCKCGFVLPVELRPEQHGFPAVSDDGAETVSSPRSDVDMDTWFRNMNEYACSQQIGLTRRSSGFGQWPYKWQKLDDKTR